MLLRTTIIPFTVQSIATPNEIWEGKKDNPIERKVVETILKKGMKVRIKHMRTEFEKGDVRTFSEEIHQIVEKKGRTNTIKNMKNSSSSQNNIRR